MPERGYLSYQPTRGLALGSGGALGALGAGGGGGAALSAGSGVLHAWSEARDGPRAATFDFSVVLASSTATRPLNMTPPPTPPAAALLGPPPLLLLPLDSNMLRRLFEP